MRKLIEFYRECRKSDTNFFLLACRYCLFLMQGKTILAHQNAIIKGIRNIKTGGILRIGTTYTGFVHRKDVTLLNIKGSLVVNGPFSIGRGCRLDIGENAAVTIGSNSYIHPFTTLIIMNKLEIGNNCAISWSCQFLDDDFHEINYENKKNVLNKKITISDNVWIGSQVSIYKGSYIARGSIVASNSVVKGVFKEENVLIAGNPAKIIKRNVTY